MKEKVIIVLGPTAAGKTVYSVALAKRRGGAVISADSRQLYAGMNIGTAKPKEAASNTPHSYMNPDSVQGISHYLLNISTPDEPLALAQWQYFSFKIIKKLHAAGTTPIVVGGTMLYLDSLINNYSIPHTPTNPTLRAQLEESGTEELYKRLMNLDPDASEFIEPHHKQRIIRALEVIEATGQPFSKQRKQQPSRYLIDVIGIFPGWSELKERISKRAVEMLDDGLLEETERLRKEYGEYLPLLKTMNYRQAASVLEGSMIREEAFEQMVRVNMRYAHRQMSWWKRKKDIGWIC